METVYSIATLQLYVYTPYSPTVFLLCCILHVNGPSCINLLFPAVRSRFCVMIYLGMPSSINYITLTTTVNYSYMYSNYTHIFCM